MDDEGLLESLRLPALLYGLIALALCAPVWISLGDQVIGHPRSDVWKHLWGDAWFRQSLFSEWPVPLHTTQVGFPDGGLLYNLDPITGFFAWFLAFLPLVWVHNLVQTAALVAGALGAMMLARRLVDHAGAAWLAGAVYGFSAHIQAVALASGIGETAHIGGLPWALWALIRVLEGVEKRAVMTLGLTLAWAAMGSWYYGLVASIACTGLLLRWVIQERAQGRLRGLTGPGPRPLRRALLGGLLGILLVLPMAESFLSSMSSEQSLHWVGSVGLQGSDLDPGSNFAVATIGDFIAPGARLQDKVDLLFFSNHLGFFALSLAVLGCVFRPRPGLLLFGGALASALLCLGPEIYLNRSSSLGPNPLFLLFQAVWPGFELVQNLERMQVGLGLCIGLLSAMGLGALIQSLELRSQSMVGALACLVVVAEANLTSGLGFPLPTASISSSEIYDTIAKKSGEFGIIELPVHHGGSGRPYWHQVQHGRPLPLSLDGNPPLALQDNALMSRFLPDTRYNRFYLKYRNENLSMEELLRAKSELVSVGFAYVVLSESEGEPELELRRLLDSVCGYPIQEDHDAGIRLYRLD
jgi:hypothetical protein